MKSCSNYSDTFDCPVGLRQGCNLSPKLSTMFINELHYIMVENIDIIGVFTMYFNVNILSNIEINS